MKMDTYFVQLAKELSSLSWPILEMTAKDTYSVNPDDFETKEGLVKACIAREQYVTFS